MIRILTAISLAASVSACNIGENSDPIPSPGETVVQLLELYAVAGQQPEDRSEKDIQNEVNRQRLAVLFTDLEDHDRFLADIYVGFLVGALARYQTRLFATVEGTRATVTAGKVVVMMQLVNKQWKIVLTDSIPPEIKQRAAEERQKMQRTDTPIAITPPGE